MGLDNFVLNEREMDPDYALVLFNYKYKGQYRRRDIVSDGKQKLPIIFF